EPKGLSYWLLLTAIITAILMWRRRWFDRRPYIGVAVSGAFFAPLIFVLYKYSTRSFLWIVLWFCLVQVATFQTLHQVTQPDGIRRTHWEREIWMYLPFIFGLYATAVYPNIKHEYGGGAPVPIVFHLTKKLPVFDSESVPVSLIDETDHGYCVLRGSDKVIFVARGLVEEVEFLRSDPT